MESESAKRWLSPFTESLSRAFVIDLGKRESDIRSVNWFPKSALKRLRDDAIAAADIIANSENHFGVINKEKQFARTQELRRKIEAKSASIGKDRVTFILNNGVPQIRDIFDLTHPKSGERPDLLPKKCVEAILENIEAQVERIEKRRDRNAGFLWKLVGIPGAILGAVGLLTLLRGCH